jgi:Cu(I)/Ag(I) efflux system membrane fusion protein
MSKTIGVALGIALLAAGLAGGYLFGVRQGPLPADAAVAGGDTGGAKTERRVLYYRNPMGLPDTSAVPKKDPMGMDYVPVYEGEGQQQAGPGGVRISVEKVQKLGVRTESAAMRELARSVRAVGVLSADERRLSAVSPRLEGWIQKLFVNTTGQRVERGQPLMEVYSPDLVSTQQEYLIAWRGVQSLQEAAPDIRRSMEQLADSALQRLRNWEISEQEIQQLRTDGQPRQTLLMRSPVSGVVLERMAVQGMRFMPGETLFRIADLSAVWLLADVYEQDLALLRVGSPVSVRVTAYPTRVFTGKVSFVYPTVAQETRTARARVELPNPDGLLKPDMYAEAEISASQGAGKRLAVPDSAIIDSGTRRVILVQREEGLFEPREVATGARGGGYVEVTSGLTVGEVVVTSANFLIDAESNLKSALAGFGGHSGHGGAAPAPAPRGAEDGSAAASRAGVIRARGQVVSVDLTEGTVTIAHEAVPDLKWPGMTMPFAVGDKTLLGTLRPGQQIDFSFVRKAEGEFALTQVRPLVSGGKTAAGRDAGAGASHKGH